MGLTLKSQQEIRDDSASAEPFAGLIDDDDPPPEYSATSEYHLDVFKKQNFDFDTSELSRSLIVAIEKNEYAQVKALLLKGENPLAENEQRWCAIHYAVRADSKRIMRALLNSKQLEDSPHEVNKADKNGETPLHLAACLGKKNMLKELLDKGADVNARSHSDRSPLFEAVEANHEDVVEILLDRKALLLPVVAPPGSSVPKRLKEMKVALNHRKLQAKKGKT